MTHLLRSLLAASLIALGGLPPAGAQDSQSDCSREVLRGLVDRYFAAAADDYFGMFAAAPVVRTPFASPCDRWENGMFATAGGTALPGEDGKAAPMGAHDCSPKGLVISNHGPRRFLVDVEAGLVVAFVHFAGSLPDFHAFKMRNGKVERINAVVGPWSASMGWAPVPECLRASCACRETR